MTTQNTPLHVIFGTGPVGLAVMDELCKRDVRIRMVNRSGRTTEPLPDGVELVNGDASDPVFATEAAAGADVIYFAVQPPYHLWPELFPPLQAGGIAAAENVGAKLVVLENVYMYGDPNGKPMTEENPFNAHTRKGAVREQMHRDLMAAHEAGRVRAVAARASDFFGPRVRLSQMGELIFEKAAQGKAAMAIGSVDALHSQTYMPDVGRALVTLAEHDEAFGRAWHVPNAPALTSRAFIEAVYMQAGHPPKIQVMPRLMVRLLSPFVKSLGELYEMLYEFEKPFIVASDQFEAAFGWRATPHDIAIAETVRWYREQA